MLLLVDSAMNWIIGSNPLPLVRLTHWIHIVAWPCGHCQMIPNAFPNPVVNSCPVTGCDHYPFHWSTSSQFSDFDPSPGSERHRFTGVGTTILQEKEKAYWNWLADAKQAKCDRARCLVLRMDVSRLSSKTFVEIGHPFQASKHQQTVFADGGEPLLVQTSHPFLTLSPVWRLPFRVIESSRQSWFSSLSSNGST